LLSASLNGDPFSDLLAVLEARGALDASDVAELEHRRHEARRVSNVDNWSLTG
jgi:hypothetical protein